MTIYHPLDWLVDVAITAALLGGGFFAWPDEVQNVPLASLTLGALFWAGLSTLLVLLALWHVTYVLYVRWVRQV